MRTIGFTGLLAFAWMMSGPARLAAQPDHIFAYTPTPTVAPTPATAAAAIDVAQKDCLGSAKAVTSTCSCLEASRIAWQAELDKALAELQTALTGTAGASSLSQAQSAWLRYRDSELALADSVLAANPGQASKICGAKTALVAARARELDTDLETVKSAGLTPQ
jgi:uncharacterized protein YecT (DUF1311 family)